MQVCYTIKYQLVKVHRVSSSSANTPASARVIQIHRVHVWDSIAVVTPFMHDANYASRGFATLEQLGLLLPFADGLWAGVRLYTYSITICRVLCFW